MAPTRIIAEIGVNHNGSLEMALDLVEKCADAGADIVKFQTFSADKLVSRDAPKANYQIRQDGEGSQYEMLQRLELSDDDHRVLMQHCVDNGVEFLSTGDSTPIASHIQYNIHTNNNIGVIPSTILTSVTNTDGSAITVKCQGKVSTGTLYINRSYNADQAGCPSSCIWTEIAT